ncbi:MAG: hypothetical protein CMH83_09605 [Nocardioides sp.]|nr:hypothetical protein [Nocardioides sp.]
MLADALETVPDGLAALERQRPRLVATLTRVARLSDTVVPLLRRTRADTVADLEHLAPVLEELLTEKRLLAKALEGYITFPFPSGTKYVSRGDYAGMFGTITLDLDQLMSTFESELPEQSGEEPAGPALPDLPELPGVPAGQTPGLGDLVDDVTGLPAEVLEDLQQGLAEGLGDLGQGGIRDLLSGGRSGGGPDRVGSSQPDGPPTTLGELLTGGAP